jgi:DNA-binding MarR family transcriptional regulator
VAKSPSSRAELLKTLDETLRNVGAQSVLISDAVARLVGLNSTDLECLDLLCLAGPTTAGQLATQSGLTTGAMTAVLDRLEHAGFARRVRDADDRRLVRVEVLQDNVRRVEMLYRPLAAAVGRLNEDYGDRQLATLVDYLARATTLGAEHLVWLQKQQPLARRAPVRQLTHRGRRGRRGASRMTTVVPQKD